MRGPRLEKGSESISWCGRRGSERRAHRLPWKRDFATGEITENAQVSFGSSSIPSHHALINARAAPRDIGRCSASFAVGRILTRSGKGKKTRTGPCGMAKRVCEHRATCVRVARA